jgi:hypothetical protein
LLSATDALVDALSALLSATDGLDESAVDCAVEIRIDWLVFWLLAIDVLVESVIASDIARLLAVDADPSAASAMLRAVESTVVPFGVFAINMPSFLRAVVAFSTRNVSPLITISRYLPQSNAAVLDGPFFARRENTINRVCEPRLNRGDRVCRRV